MRYFILLLTCLLIGLNTPALAQAVSVKKSSQTVSSGGMQYYLHKVSRNETLYSLAKAYEVSEKSIIDKNPFLKDGIKARQTILIPTKETYKLSQETKAEENNQKKDTLVIISPDTGIKEYETPKTECDLDTKKEPTKTGLTKDFDRTGTINVAVIMPFDNPSNRDNVGYTDFFNGVLLALADLKSAGVSTRVDLISCGSKNKDEDSSAEAMEAIESGKLDDANLIIGPVYKDTFVPIAQWATEHKIPIVSPLSVIDSLNSPYIINAAPCESTKYSKLRSMFQDIDANILIMKHSTYNDETNYNELMSILPSNIRMLNDIKEREVSNSEISSLLDKNKENILILPINNEAAVASLLEKINFVAFNSISRYKITVIGLPRWARFSNVNTETLFKLNTMFVANYHENRNEEVMHNFYAKYIEEFANIPTMYAMRGYDVAKIFISAMAESGPRVLFDLQDKEETPLQVKYRFGQDSDTSYFSNKEWMLINYSPDYRVVVK